MRVSIKDCERAAEPIVNMLNAQHSDKSYYYAYYHTHGIVTVNKQGGGIGVVIPNNGRNDYNTELMFNNIQRFINEMNRE